MTSSRINTQNYSRITSTDLDNVMAKTNQSLVYQQFYWQRVPQQSSNAAAPSPAATMYLFPHTIGSKQEPDEELRVRKLKRQIKNRETAARSRAKKLAYIQGLEQKACQLEEEKRKLIQQKELNAKLLMVPKEATELHLRRTNSATF